MMVYPVAGRLVRDPRSKQVLPAAGRDVPQNSFWMRRLRDGDVTDKGPSKTDAPVEHAQAPAPVAEHVEEPQPASGPDAFDEAKDSQDRSLAAFKEID